MESSTLPDLVALLSGRTLTVRTGLWLASLRLLGQEDDSAARLGIDARDLRDPIRAGLPEGTRFLGLTTDTVIEALETICLQTDGSDTLLIYNLDLLLARLNRQERLDFWQFVYSGFRHRPRGLLLLMPKYADSLLPTHEKQDAWRRDGRLVVDPDTNQEG
jgi:hypothetical protein